MALIDDIESLQNKPEGVRRRIALVTTIVVTGIIILVWIGIASINSGPPVKSDSSFFERQIERISRGIESVTGKIFYDRK